LPSTDLTCAPRGVAEKEQMKRPRAMGDGHSLGKGERISRRMRKKKKKKKKKKEKSAE
jgi:hypothetical protein